MQTSMIRASYAIARADRLRCRLPSWTASSGNLAARYSRGMAYRRQVQLSRVMAWICRANLDRLARLLLVLRCLLWMKTINPYRWVNWERLFRVDQIS